MKCVVKGTGGCVLHRGFLMGREKRVCIDCIERECREGQTGLCWEVVNELGLKRVIDARIDH